MKKLFGILIIALALIPTSCGHRKKGKPELTHEDSVKISNARALQAQLTELGKVREDLTCPVADGNGTVSRGARFTTYMMDDSAHKITREFEKMKARLEHAQKDSSTPYGALMTRFRLLDTQHKYLTGTYTDSARLLRFSSEITFDDKHEEERDFYFNNGKLVLFKEHRTYTSEEQDFVTNDCYFMYNDKVGYSYRDEGTSVEQKDKMDLMNMKRYALTGDVAAHVYQEFKNFKGDYEILLNQPLEPLLYTSEADAK